MLCKSSKVRPVVSSWATLGLCAWLGGCAAGGDELAVESEPSAQNATPADAVGSEVVTSGGTVRGEAADEGGKRVLSFRGVPYAAAPTGALRWKAPQAATPWAGVRDATKWGDRCPQGESTLSSPGSTSEDCLNLSVLTPATKASEKLPVMVFFHGGGLTVGTGNSPTYGHTALPAQGVITVLVNHRLGAFGYFSHPALAKESDKDSSGNYGTLDLIASLQWVQKNIGAFGGDAGNVTIFGESGGGTKVLSCMASPLAKGLFHRAIIESGSASSAQTGTTPRATAEERGKNLLKKLGIPEGEGALAALRGKSWQDVLAASTATDSGFVTNLAVDGYVLPQSIYDAFAAGKQADVPLIVGANQGEVRELSNTVPGVAVAHKSVSSKAYVYNFAHLPLGWRAPGCFAFHGLELPYVFGHIPGIPGATIKFLGTAAGCPVDLDPKVGPEDETVAKNTMAIWKQFATTGNPSVPGLIDWPAYTAETDQYLEIAAELKVKKGVKTSGIAPGTGAPKAPATPATPAAPTAP